jgi:hypothetical protein
MICTDCKGSCNSNYHTTTTRITSLHRGKIPTTRITSLHRGKIPTTRITSLHRGKIPSNWLTVRTNATYSNVGKNNPVVRGGLGP